MSFPCTVSEISKSGIAAACAKQRTLKTSATVSGNGLFTGEKVTLRLHPAKAGTGVVFKRLDLPNKLLLPATLDYVQGTPRCTMIGIQSTFVQTVEHLLSTLKAYQIDNVLIEIDGPEVPILDGSARGYVELIEQAGVAELAEKRAYARLEVPVYWSKNDIHLVALPSDEYRLSFTLHYPHSALVGTQFYSFLVNEEGFKREIAPSRTFSLYEEIAPLIEKGLLKGTLDNGVLIKDNAVVNPEGLRFKDEMVRHKVLDLLGDLSLIALPFTAHIIAIRSGHTSNIAFAKELYSNLTKMENS